MGVDATEQHEISGSRGEAHLVWKCKMCGREHTICRSLFRLIASASVFADRAWVARPAFDESFSRSKAVYTLEDSENQEFAPLAVLECRGCEITQFDPKGVWQAKGESGTKFEEIDLSLEETEWNDYDEKVCAPGPCGRSCDRQLTRVAASPFPGERSCVNHGIREQNRQGVDSISGTEKRKRRCECENPKAKWGQIESHRCEDSQTNEEGYHWKPDLGRGVSMTPTASSLSNELSPTPPPSSL